MSPDPTTEAAIRTLMRKAKFSRSKAERLMSFTYFKIMLRLSTMMNVTHSEGETLAAAILHDEFRKRSESINKGASGKKGRS